MTPESAIPTQPLAPPSPADWSRPVVLEARVVTGTGGGPDKTILNTPRFLDPHGYRTLCAFMHPPDDPGFDVLRARARESGAEIVSIPDRGPFDHRVVRACIDLCRRENVALWHGHDYKSNALGLLVRRFHRMKLLSTVHGWGVHGSRTKLYYGIDRWCLRRYDRVICVSPDLRTACLRAGVGRERCTFIENAIDLDRYRRSQSAPDAKRALGVPPERLVIAAIGRLSPEKNYPQLIRAVARLIDEGLDVALVIAGDGPERAALEALIESLNPSASKRRRFADGSPAEADSSDAPRANGRVRLLGFVADPRTVCEAADVFALSSLREAFPNVLLEAMAMSVPVVASAVAAVPRIVEHEQSGLLVPPGDEEALADALRRMAAERDLRENLGRAGRDAVESNYTFPRRIEKVLDVYRSLGVDPVVPTA